MKLIIKRYFSMVEVALAVAILAVGATTVVTLVPVGMKQTRDSICQNYSAVCISDMHSYISKKSTESWNDLNSIPTYKTSYELSPETANWINIKGNIYIPNDIPSNSGIYGVKIHSGTSNSPDFTAQAIIWQTPVAGQIDLSSGSGGGSSGGEGDGGGGGGGTTPSYTITSGDIGISPTGSNYSFDLVKPDGGSFTRDDMQANKKNDTYNDPGVTFSATSVKMRTKGGGPDVVVDGLPISLQGKNVTFTAASGNPMSVRVWKDNPGMGQWYIEFTGHITTLTADDGSDLGLPSGTPIVTPPSSTVGSANTLSKGINIELSWPLERPYAMRDKVKYYFEVYNLSQIAP